MGSECQKSESPVNIESWNSSELKFKSSHAWKSQTEDISSISDLPANRHGVPSKSQKLLTCMKLIYSVFRGRVINFVWGGQTKQV